MANSDSGTLSVLSVAGLAQTTIAVGGHPSAIALLPEGGTYVVADGTAGTVRTANRSFTPLGGRPVRANDDLVARRQRRREGGHQVAPNESITSGYQDARRCGLGGHAADLFHLAANALQIRLDHLVDHLLKRCPRLPAKLGLGLGRVSE